MSSSDLATDIHAAKSIHTTICAYLVAHVPDMTHLLNDPFRRPTPLAQLYKDGAFGQIPNETAQCMWHTIRCIAKSRPIFAELCQDGFGEQQRLQVIKQADLLLNIQEALNRR